MPRELGFLVLGMPIAIVGLGILNGMFWTGLGTLVIWIGLFITLAALYVARAFGTVERVRLRWSGRAEIAAPRWRPEHARAGFWRVTFGPFANGHYWLYLLHGLIVNPIVSIFSWTVTIVWTAITIGGTTSWIWYHFIPADRGNDQFVLSRVIVEAIFPGARASFDPVTGDIVLQTIAGVFCLITLPFITRGLTTLHATIAGGLLGAWRSEALEREVADLSASRGAAVHAEDQGLRRLERDIHDGPQQRLVRLQMDISSAERKLASDPDAARDLLAQADAQAKEALEELRALSRGFAPPILQDRGLIAALQSLTARSTVPVTFDNGIPIETRFTPEIERSAYFVAAELLTNVAKHATAAAANLSVAVQRDSTASVAWLEIRVSDNGVGGATAHAGHGLSGLGERLRGLRGTLRIDSPLGGPTQITAQLPLPKAETARAREAAPILEG